MAQVTPSAVQDMAFGRSGSDFYIQGGYVAINSISQSVSSQLVALDLSSPWGVTSPAWRALANGTASRTFYGVGLPTNKTFLTFKYLDPNQYTIANYDVTSNTWSLPKPVTTVPDILSYGLRPVVDPTSGLVYIAGMAGMNVYNPTTQLWTAPVPISGLTARYFGSAMYNTARKTIMYVGGYNYGVAPTHFDPVVVVTEFSPSTSTWTVLTTSGTPPSPRADHCSAISEDGKTLVVFGGRTSIVTPTFTGSIYLLDITTGVWSTGLPQSTPRIYVACTLVGDQFVAWGGSADANNTLPSVQPIVFDTTLKKWVDAYKPPQYYIDNPPKKPTPSSGTGSNGGSGSGGGGIGGGSDGGSSNNGGGPGPGSDSTHNGLAPIIGGVVGGLVVIGAIVGFLVYRRRQNRRFDEVTEQVSLQRMVIEAERSNKGVTQNSSNHHNDGGDGGAGAYTTAVTGVGSGYTGSNNGGKDDISTTISYPTPPAYSSNSNNKTTAHHQQDKKSAFSPYLPHKQGIAYAPNNPTVYTAAIGSPSMSSSSAAGLSPNNSNNFYNNYDINHNSSTSNLLNNNSPRGPQLTKKSGGPQAVQILNGPQEYYSPAGRAPQTVTDGVTDANFYYHEQESGRRRQNHPQEGGVQY
ncbi:hypothetical protein BGX30_012193 [Mortierella sp. GBA39]|nr:hypothetical protein BGX30_012193 [Mortierella sp. GBA39]